MATAALVVVIVAPLVPLAVPLAGMVMDFARGLSRGNMSQAVGRLTGSISGGAASRAAQATNAGIVQRILHSGELPLRRGGSFTETFATVYMGVAQLFILAVCSYYFSAEGGNMLAVVERASPPRRTSSGCARSSWPSPGRCWWARAADCGCAGRPGGGDLLRLGLPSAIVLTLLTAVGALVPTVGSAIVWMPVAVALGLGGRVQRRGDPRGAGRHGDRDGGQRTAPVLLPHGRRKMHPLLLFLGIFGGLRPSAPGDHPRPGGPRALRRGLPDLRQRGRRHPPAYGLTVPTPRYRHPPQVVQHDTQLVLHWHDPRQNWCSCSGRPAGSRVAAAPASPPGRMVRSPSSPRRALTRTRRSSGGSASRSCRRVGCGWLRRRSSPRPSRPTRRTSRCRSGAAVGRRRAPPPWDRRYARGARCSRRSVGGRSMGIGTSMGVTRSMGTPMGTAIEGERQVDGEGRVRRVAEVAVDGSIVRGRGVQQVAEVLGEAEVGHGAPVGRRDVAGVSGCQERCRARSPWRARRGGRIGEGESSVGLALEASKPYHPDATCP
ncbi:MAG: AI-2E family transporter [Deltaproteobacteria bacterium]|nr:AI-2E family transporter [Deltaproteobacteria bacterium]